MIRIPYRGTIVVPIGDRENELEIFDEFFSGMSHGVCRQKPYAVNEYIISDYRVYVSPVGNSPFLTGAVTQYLIDHYEPNFVMNLGLAVSLVDSFIPGDICSVSSTFPWDVSLHNGTKLMRGGSSIPLKVDTNPYYALRLNNACHAPFATLVSGGDLPETSDRKGLHSRYDCDLADTTGSIVNHVSALNMVPCAILKAVADDSGDNARIMKELLNRLTNFLTRVTSLEDIYQTELPSEFRPRRS